jgi:hypothetical protein
MSPVSCSVVWQVGTRTQRPNRWPWLANFVASMRGCDREAELYGVIVLSRNILAVCEREKICGNQFYERLCRAVLYRIRQFADFAQLQDETGSLRQVKDAQRRLEGLVGKCA